MTSAPPTTPPKGELASIFHLAVPLVLANAGNALMGLVDTMMVGPVGKAALSGVGVGNSLFFTLTLFAWGCVMGMDAPVSQALGAGDRRMARRVLWQALRVALVTGLLSTLIVGLSPLLLETFGVNAATAHEARRYVWARLPSLLPMLAFVACRGYLQASGTTRPIVVAIIVANLLNVVFNYVFIYGDEGLARLGLPAIGMPALGTVGAALATDLCQALSLILLARAIAASDAPADPARRAYDPALSRTIFRLGVPMGLQTLAEIGVFALANLLAARIGSEAAAGHQVAISLASFTFMMTVGVGAATSIRVGYAVGRGDTPAARHAGFTGLGLGACCMSISALCFLLFPEWLAGQFTAEDDVVRAAVPLLGIAAVFQIFDGIQAVATGALRGAGDAKVPLYANIVAHWGVGFPLMLFLALHLELGARGLWWGLTGGLITVALGLTWRFHILSRREIKRVN